MLKTIQDKQQAIKQHDNMYALQGYKKRFQKYINAIHDNISLEQREILRHELKVDHMLKDIDPLIDGSLEGAQRVRMQNPPTFISPLKSANIELLWHPSLSEVSVDDFQQLLKDILDDKIQLDALCLEGSVMQDPNGTSRFHMLANATGFW